MVGKVVLIYLHVVLGLEEEGQDVLVAPARIALIRPLVEVLPVASYVHHAIDDRRAAKHLASRPVTPLLIGGQTSFLFGLCAISPVYIAVDKVQEHGWNLRSNWLIVPFLQRNENLIQMRIGHSE